MCMPHWLSIISDLLPVDGYRRSAVDQFRAVKLLSIAMIKLGNQSSSGRFLFQVQSTRPRFFAL